MSLRLSEGLFKVLGGRKMSTTLQKIREAAEARIAASGNQESLEETPLNSVLGYVILLVAAVGAIFCVTLGVKFARAEEPQEREKAKQHLKNAIIGYVLIFILVVAIRVGTPILLDWMGNNSK